MCDALVALPDATRNGAVVFAKNSDRPAGECQVLGFFPARSSGANASIRCSYLQVPDDRGALATLGLRPYWCWGFETGLNEAGVVGGNTAIFTKSLHIDNPPRELGLTGMDLLRFGLERGATAERAVDEICALLERYGQWGSAVRGLDHAAGSYENAFLLADRKEAWVLETSGRRWAARRVENGYQALSNQPTIRGVWTKSSPDLRDFARDSGWWSADVDNFDFARIYGDHAHYAKQVSHLRWRRVSQVLQDQFGKIAVGSVMGILRDHYEDTFLGGPQFTQFLPDFHTVCMHDSPSRFTWGNTATSMIVELAAQSEKPPMIWLAYLPPCTSAYIGFSWTESLPAMLTSAGKAGLFAAPPQDAPKDEFDSGSLWWRLNRVVEAVRANPVGRYAAAAKLLGAAQEKNLEEMSELADAHPGPAGWLETIERQVSRITDALETLEEEWKK